MGFPIARSQWARLWPWRPWPGAAETRRGVGAEIVLVSVSESVASALEWRSRR
jgi:hypothetical protein